jgi:hypothetical protein
MNILIFINHAEETFNFLRSVGRELQSKHNVTFLCESEFAYKKFKQELKAYDCITWPSCDSVAEFELTEDSIFFDENYWDYFYPDIDREFWWNAHSARSQDWYMKYLLFSSSWLREELNGKKIDVIIYEQLTTAPAFILQKKSKELGIRYLGLQQSRIPGRFEVFSDKYDFIESVGNKYQSICAGNENIDVSIQKLVDDYFSQIMKIQPSYMKKNGEYAGLLSFKLNYIEKFKNLFNSVGSCSYQVKDYKSMVFARAYLKFKRFIRGKLYLALISEPDFADKFFLYPLHFHPEASTSVYAKNFDDELATIRNIAMNLPLGYQLYVKEHTAALGIRPLAFYKMLKNIPNIKVVSHDVNTKELIKKSMGVITLTSTVGYEAVLLGKPVILFGRVFYESAPNVYRVFTWNELFSICKELLSNQSSPSIEARTNFLASYFMSTLEGNVFIAGAERKDNVTKVLKELNLL